MKERRNSGDVGLEKDEAVNCRVVSTFSIKM